jgi:chemotaxis protein histidine kinase CheA/CheY-like chemotaxis protein
MAIDRVKFIGKFVEEAREHIRKINEGLLILEKRSEDKEALSSVFRSAHTIKGSSRMLKLNTISEIAHKMEDTLEALRGERIQCAKEIFDLLFNGIDIISELVEKTASGQDITMDTSKICKELEMASKGSLKEKEVVEVKEQKTLSADVAKKADKPKADSTIRVNAEKLDEIIKLMGEMVSNQSKLKQRIADLRKLEASLKKNMETTANLRDDGFSSAQQAYLSIRQISSNIRDDVNLQELLTADLQEKALKMRMLPISTIFDTFHRAVRDMSTSLSKKVDLFIEGGETELDKKIIEKIGDPIIHMIRNSIDHGIEKPEDRINAGKPETGTIKLSACYEGGSVAIEIADDGAGIPIKKIREKALHKDICSQEQLDNMSESEIIELIFHPGFSTAEIITDLSGRGVGMDVVRKNIVEALKGAIRINTKEGRGTTFYITLPLTLSIMRILLFTVSDMVFAISASFVHEIIKVAGSEVIDIVDKKAIRLREEIIPIVKIETLLNLSVAAKHPGNDDEERDALIIIINAGNEKLGLIVDSLINEEETVIKPLPSHLKKIKWVAGVIITGKNEVVNLLHAPMIIASAKEAKDTGHYRRFTEEEKKQLNILVVDDSINTREIEKSILEVYGYKVDLAGDGIEAIEKAKEFKYDLIITDIEMPRLDGFSLTEKFRQDEAYKHTPIIIVTSREKEEDKKRGIQVGADAYIVKGAFDQTNLLETVQNLIG